jgi:hypothetical protein
VDEQGQETHLHALGAFESSANSVAIRHDGKQIAVGLRDGTVMVFSTAGPSGGGTAELVIEVAPPQAFMAGGGGADNAVASLCFSPDGTKLAAGRDSAHDFTVYDMAAAAAVVHQFARPNSRGWSLAFVRGEIEMLVTGGGMPGTYAVHALGPPRSELTHALPSSAGQPKDAADGSADIIIAEGNGDGVMHGLVAMTAGSRLDVVGMDGVVRLSKDLGAAITCEMARGNVAVRLQPGSGGLVACVL